MMKEERSSREKMRTNDEVEDLSLHRKGRTDHPWLLEVKSKKRSIRITNRTGRILF